MILLWGCLAAFSCVSFAHPPSELMVNQNSDNMYGRAWGAWYVQIIQRRRRTTTAYLFEYINELRDLN